jgi:hypothetical protein
MFKEGERKVPKDTAVLMIGMAFTLDLVNLCVEYITFGVGGIIVDFLSAAIFNFWLKDYKIDLWGDGNASFSLLAAFASAIPIADLCFPWTIRVGYAVLTERKEVPKEARIKVSPVSL